MKKAKNLIMEQHLYEYKKAPLDFFFNSCQQYWSLCITGEWNLEVSKKSNLALPGGHCVFLLDWPSRENPIYLPDCFSPYRKVVIPWYLKSQTIHRAEMWVSICQCRLIPDWINPARQLASLHEWHVLIRCCYPFYHLKKWNESFPGIEQIGVATNSSI